ncbi:MAG TPA: hypothetical protein VGM88_08360 [Kofleriaceae bacterium]|jgi:hypothetical protein
MRNAIAGSLVLVCAWAGAAAAERDSIEVQLQVDASHVSPTRAPEIHATVIGAPELPAKDFELREVGDGHGVAVASKKRSWAQGDDRLALMVVMQSNEMWIGNTHTDKLAPDDPSRTLGALWALEQEWPAFDGPMAAGSQAGLVVYAEKAEVRVPLGPIAKLTKSALGTEADYFGRAGNDLAAGAALGYDQLAKSDAPIKLLLVIGDGNATNPETDKPALAELYKRARREGIHVVELVYKSSISDPETIYFGKTLVINASATLAQRVAAAVHDVTARQYLVFPGERLTWDGRTHELALMIHGTATDPVELTSAPYASGFPTPWIFLVTLGGGLVLLVAWTRWYSAGA